MENRSHALLAGVFALVLGSLLVVAIWWFSGGREPLRYYELVSRGNVTGLNPEANVRYRGMQAGKVHAIAIDPADPRNLLVTIRLRADLPVTRATRASLGYQGVTGLAFVLLEDDGSDPVPLAPGVNGLPRIALAPGLFDQIGSAALLAVERVRTLAEGLAGVFGPEGIARLERTLVRLESAVTGMDQTFADAPATLAAIKALFRDDNLLRIERLLRALNEAGEAAAPAARELRDLLAELRALTGRLDATLATSGQTLNEQTLPELNRTLQALGQASLRVGQLSEELARTPQMLVLGRERPPPGPGEAGFGPSEGK